MSYAINFKLLSEDEKEELEVNGVELGRSFAKFSRDLSWDEITTTFALFTSLKRRTPNLEESHVNFAIGDCLNEMERLFGKRKTKKFITEFLELSAMRDQVLNLAGGMLIYLQTVENLIQVCCASIQLKALKLSLADFLSDDPTKRRHTLGQMKSALVGTNAFSAEFADQFDRFVKARNRFAHSLWTEEERANPYTGLPPKDHFIRIHKFIRELGQQAYQVEKVFKGLLGILRVSLTAETDPSENLSSKSNPWLKYIPQYQKALRKVTQPINLKPFST